MVSPFDVRASPFDASPFDVKESTGRRGAFPATSPFDVPNSAVQTKAEPAATAADDPPTGPPGTSATASAAPSPSEDRPSVHTDKTRYFVITSSNKENVVKSVKYNLWATQRKNEQRLDEAFRTAPAVVLIFSVNRSDCFQGYARMRSLVGQPASSSVDPFNKFGRLFDLEWLRLHDLPFREVDHLRNPLNGDRPVQTSRDGQELSNMCGRRLCTLIDQHIDEPDRFLPRTQASADEEPPVKRRRAEAPEPTEALLEGQVEYFLSLSFENYCEWYARFGSTRPGPVAPSASSSFVPPAGQHPHAALHPGLDRPPGMLGWQPPPLHIVHHMPPMHRPHFPLPYPRHLPYHMPVRTL
mmetsp:Transcript_62995/g.137616  ORF Transcript_62995/g.137616 Transcript_62995/m.137616 type:complete len:355 (-) Transcript_62995:177-1241(-)